MSTSITPTTAFSHNSPNERWRELSKIYLKKVENRSVVFTYILNTSCTAAMFSFSLGVAMKEKGSEHYSQNNSYTSLSEGQYQTVVYGMAAIFLVSAMVTYFSLPYFHYITELSEARRLTIPAEVLNLRRHLIAKEYTSEGSHLIKNRIIYHPVMMASSLLMEMGVLSLQVFKQLEALKLERDQIVNDGILKRIRKSASLEEGNHMLKVIAEQLKVWNEKWNQFIPVLTEDLPSDLTR